MKPPHGVCSFLCFLCWQSKMSTGRGKHSKRRYSVSFSSNSSSTDDSTTAKRLKRQVQLSTFEKWQRELDKEHNMLPWHCCEQDRREQSLVSTLHCKVCREYDDKIIGFRNFSNAWINGSSNQKTSNIVDHARSDQHKAAMNHMHTAIARGQNKPLLTCSSTLAYS